MPVLPNSRYANSTVTAASRNGTDIAVIVPSQQIAYSFTFVYHQVVTGDRAETLAYQYYTDPTLWWRIADANPEVLFWDDLTPGTIIRVPQL